MTGVRSNVFRLVLPSNLETVPFPVLSASLCIFSLNHTRNVGRIAIKGSPKQAEADVSLSLLSQQSSFFIVSHLTIFFCLFWLDCFSLKTVIIHTIPAGKHCYCHINIKLTAVSKRTPCSLRSALTRVCALLSVHPNVVRNREVVCDFGYSLTFPKRILS